jgi:hypothetical protein
VLYLAHNLTSTNNKPDRVQYNAATDFDARVRAAGSRHEQAKYPADSIKLKAKLVAKSLLDRLECPYEIMLPNYDFSTVQSPESQSMGAMP